MATLEKIRSKGILLLVVVGAALVIFIVGDLVNSGSSYFSEASANVAKINGDKIKIRNYAERIEQFNDVVRLEYGSNINDEMSEQIRQMVWNSTVTEKIIGDECKKAGMMITTSELADMLVGNHISPLMQNNRMFMNQNGQFDVNMVRQFITTIDSEEAATQIPYDQLALYRNYWRYWEHAVKINRLQEKYTSLVSKSLVVNPLEAKYAYNNSKTSADAVYAMKNYFAIADSTITVSDAEIQKLYKQKKAQFKQKQSADVNYIAVEIKPSQADFDEIEKWINNLKEEFTTTTDIAGLTNSNSDLTYRGDYLVKEQIDKDFQEFSFSGQAGDVMGPILADNTYKMARIIETGVIRPDSVKLSHIYLRADNAEKTQTLADSILTALKSGADFAETAKKHSLAQTAENGGEIGWISEMGLENKIATPAFTTKEGEFFQIKEGNDINLFKVEKIGKPVAKAKVAILSRAVDASSRTQTNLYNKAKQFIVENNTLETFTANAKDNGYTVSTASNIDINAGTLNNLKKAREVVRWIFENKEGALSDVFEVDNNLVMVAISDIKEEGYKSVDEVKPMLTAEIKNEKKGTQITNEMNGKNIEQLATMGFRIDTVRNVNFASNYAGSIGNEPKLFAQIAKAEPNKMSQPVAGNTGAFAYKVINKTENNREYNEKEEINLLTARESYMTQYMIIEALKKAANIEDMRYKYY